MKSYVLPLPICNGRIEPEGSDLTRVILLSNLFAVIFPWADWSEISSMSENNQFGYTYFSDMHCILTSPDEAPTRVSTTPEEGIYSGSTSATKPGLALVCAYRF